jgi:hypothetical protein
MADKPKEDTGKRVNGDETTTANDGDLAINKTPEPSGATAVTDAPAPTDVNIKPADESPVVLSEADIAAAQKENDPHESLGEQIEVLTGEVQALEAKIEKLTSGVGDAASPATTPTPPIAKSSEETVVSTPPAVQPANPEPLVAPPVVETPKAPVKTETPPIVKKDEPKPSIDQPAKPVNDIYSKVIGSSQGKTPPADHKDLNDEASIDEGTTGIGTIGEVLIVFGIISLLVLFASPFFKTTLAGNWEAVKSIGWPTAAISLVLGFLLFLFNRGRAGLKFLAFILFILAAVMTLLVFDYGSLLGPLAPMLEPIASFYK